jgi:small subunit ribosomal protein S17
MRDIGLDVSAPAKECSDPKCPFHGNLPVRGQVFSCTVVSDKMDNTVVVMREFEKRATKYERFEKRQSKIHGDRVRIAECRPLSKTKSYVVVEVVK